MGILASGGTDDAKVVSPGENPGVRVEPNLLSEDEEIALEKELRSVVSQYGINHISPELNEVYDRQMDYIPQQTRPLINMVRVTGRFESEAQKLAPWGYGDNFDAEKVPPLLRKLLLKVQHHYHCP
jgi:hypothetical protein